MKKKFVSILLVICMALYFVPTAAFAAQDGTDEVATSQDSVVDESSNTESADIAEEGEEGVIATEEATQDNKSSEPAISSSGIEDEEAQTGSSKNTAESKDVSTKGSISIEETSGDFEYSANSDGTTCTITGYSGTDTTVAVPETIGTYTVTIIGQDAFEYEDKIVTVTLPSTITEIGSSAFKTASRL